MKIINKKELQVAIKEWKRLEKEQNQVYTRLIKKYKVNQEADEWLWEFFGWKLNINDSFVSENLKKLGYEIK